ncbi:MAG: FAD-dependent oxidoreductase [Candidatus Pacebacteria bacterium]|nr:FAD-dependent oxidoreductase [Candidatus Paceibacterota bacterium]
MKKSTSKFVYDLIIIGSGPAGLTASIYASRYKMRNLVLGKQAGGTIGLAHKVENYPGFVSISGLELMQKMEVQVERLGAEVFYDPAEDIKKTAEGFFQVTTDLGKSYLGKTLILATGTTRRKLGIPGEEEFLGRGVSYCTTCDAPFFKGKTVALVGGSDGAVSGAVHTAEFARKVYLIYRKDKLRAEPIWVEQAIANPRIKTIYNTNVLKIEGDKVVRKVMLDRPHEDSRELTLDGVFIEIGGIPGTSLAKIIKVALNEAGFVKVDQQMRTNVAGIFAAGDLTDFRPTFQQVVTVQAMGAVAAASAYQYLRKEQAPLQRGA